MHKDLLKSISYLYLLQVVSQLLPLITVPYLARTLGLGGFGEIQMASAFAAIGTQWTDWGFSFSGTHSVAKLKGNQELLVAFIANSIAAKSILFFIWVIASICAYMFYYNSTSITYYVVTLLIVLSNTFAPQWIFQGLEKFAEASITSILVRIVFTALIFVVVKTPEDAIYTLVLGVIAGAIISLLLWLRLPYFRLLRPSMVSVPAIWRVLAEGSAVFFTTIMIAWYTTGALIVVGLIGGTNAAGIYAISEKIVSACKSAMGPIVQVLYVRISSILNISKEEFLSITKIYFVLLFICFLLGFIFLMLFRSLLFNLVFHVSASRAGAVLIPLALTMPVLVLANWFVTVGLLARGRTREWRNVIVSGPVLSICVAAILIPFLPAEVAVAYGVLAAELAVLTYGYVSWRNTWQ